ncbi:MAG TPA: heavy metal-binding domain-containing protein, partial [Candidatus Binatia bacterium]|nr:heavy metal-binding domain-containing protein [Candidatus Binatia bacterium]
MSTKTVPPTLEKDPVCGMNVDPATAKYVHEHAGKKYYFCCAGCQKKFVADPAGYLNKPKSSGLVTLGMPSTPPKASATPPLSSRAEQPLRDSGTDAQSRDLVFASAPAPKPPEVRGPKPEVSGQTYVCPMCPEVRETKPVPCPSCGMALEPETPITASRTEYTCPMHPQIVRSEPGSCPICGMALEPRTVTAAQEENPELRDMTRRFWMSVVLTVPLLAITMGTMLWPHAFTSILSGARLPWLEFALATPVVLWCGLPFFQRFWTSLVNRSPNMFTLIGLGTGVAYVYSVVATIVPNMFPASLRRMGGYPDVYFEAAAAITALVLLG